MTCSVEQRHVQEGDHHAHDEDGEEAHTLCRMGRPKVVEVINLGLKAAV